MSTTTAPVTTRKPSVAAVLKEARARYDLKVTRVLDYELSPAKSVDGTPLPMPLRFRIALASATRQLRTAEDNYLAAYPSAKYRRITTPLDQ